MEEARRPDLVWFPMVLWPSTRIAVNIIAHRISSQEPGESATITSPVAGPPNVIRRACVRGKPDCRIWILLGSAASRPGCLFPGLCH